MDEIGWKDGETAPVRIANDGDKEPQYSECFE